MLVIHNDPGSGGRVGLIEPHPLRRYAFGSLLAYADQVHNQLFKEPMLVCHSLPLSSGVGSYDSGHLCDVAVKERYDSVMCHLILDHGGVVAEDFFAAVRSQLLKPAGVLLNPVKSIAKNEVARVSPFDLETQTAPCVVKKDDNYNDPGTVLRFQEQAELEAWQDNHTAEERRGMVVHKLLDYVGREQSKMYQLERWIVVFDDLTVNHRCSDEFYIKSGTSLSYYVRDERSMAADLKRLDTSGYDWKGRSIDCSYESDAEGWDARYAVLKQCRDAFHFDYAELDVMQPSHNEFVVIDVNQTPGPSYKNVYFRELAVRLLAEGLGIPLAIPDSSDLTEAAPQKHHEPPKGQQAEQIASTPFRSAEPGRKDAQLSFQLAQGYQQAGQLEQALAAYQKRALLDQSSDEERFVAQLEVGRLSVRLKRPEAVVLSELLRAYMLRPVRAEPLYELARYFREQQNAPLATLFAKAGVKTERPDDRLFVVDDVYEWRLLDELGLATKLCGDHASAKRSFEDLVARSKVGVAIPEDDLRRIQSQLAELADDQPDPMGE